MKKIQSWLCLFLIILYNTITSIVYAEKKQQNSLLDVLETSYETNRIDYETYLIYKFYAVFEPNHPSILWAKLEADTSFIIKSGTPIVREILSNWNILTPDHQRDVKKLLTVIPGDYDAFYDSDNFRIFYDISGIDAPIQDDIDRNEDWKIFTDLNSNGRWNPGEPLNDDVGQDGIAGTRDLGEGDGLPQHRTLSSPGEPNAAPDYVEKLAKYFEYSRTKEMAMGYNAPSKRPAENLYYVGIENMGSYGVTTALEFYATNNCYTHIKVENDYSGFPDNDDLEGKIQGAMKVTAAHELFHAIKAGYDWNEDLWWNEATSVWMEEQVYPIVNDYHNYLDDWFENPERSLDANAPHLHMYGSGIFPLYLSQSYNQVLIYNTWKKAQDDNPKTNQSLSLIETTLGEQTPKTTLANTFKFFTAKNYNKDWYIDGSDYPDIKIETSHNVYPVGEQTKTLNHLSSNYIEFNPDDLSVDKIIIVEIDGPDRKDFNAIAVKEDNNGNKIEEEIALDQISKDGTYVVQIFGKTFKKFVIIFSNGTKDENSLEYKYSAKIQSIDVALVLDRSGSMGTYGYMEPAKSAAKNFIGLMELGDNAAVTSFNTTAMVNFPFTKLVSEATKAEARSRIDNISSSGRTSIGIGMQTGQRELNKANSKIQQGMVLLSDGYENEPPWVEDVLNTIPENTDIYTIALGPNSDYTILNKIATTTGGFFSNVSDPGALQKIYNAIRTKVTGENLLATFNGNIAKGQTVNHIAQVDGSVSKAKFTVIWPGSDIDLKLIDPNGKVIDPNYAATDPNISFTSGETYEYYNIISPVAGQWKLNITGIDITGSSEHYDASVTAFANLKMDIFFDRDQYGRGQPIVIAAKIVDNGKPVTGATVTAEVQTPTTATALVAGSYQDDETNTDRKTVTNQVQTFCRDEATGAIVDQDGTIYYTNAILTLYDDGHHGDGAANDGVYADYFRNTSVAGSYTFEVKARGTSPTSGAFTREAIQSTVVTQTATFMVSGQVTYFAESRPVPGCDVQLIVNADTSHSITDQNGTYNFNIPASLVKIRATRADSYQTTINFLDLSLIQQYLYSGRPLTDAQKIAADVNQDGIVTRYDENAIRRYIYRRPFLTYHTGDWIFRNTQGDTCTIIDINSDTGGLDFKGYLLGDLDGSWARTHANAQVELSKSAGPDLEHLVELPKTFELAQNYPNPFNPVTTIDYAVPEKFPEGQRVILKVYNVDGQLVQTLVDAHKEPGYYSVQWAGQDDQGRAMPSGMYFYIIKIGNFNSTKKMLLIR